METGLTLPQATAYTLGVEEEYQLVDLETGALRDQASTLREQDWTGELVAELQESTIEIGTPICSSAAEVSAQLERLRFQTSAVAAAHGVGIVAAGLHPFAEWKGHARPPLERYSSIEARYGRIARDEHIFGMHVHIAIPERHDRLALMARVRHYLPHLLALSASSPYLEGEDTGFASFRTILWRRWPNSGIPPRFETEQEFNDYVAVMLDAGVMADPWNLYWSLRPHPKYPTLEFRVTDVCPSLRDAVAIAALTRAIVCAACEGALDDEMKLTPIVEHELLRVNEWRVARDGLGARIIDATTGASHMPARDAIRRLVDRVARCAEALGDGAELAHVETILERGNATERMRRVLAEQGRFEALMSWLVDETVLGTGVDRRLTQRVAG